MISSRRHLTGLLVLEVAALGLLLWAQLAGRASGGAGWLGALLLAVLAIRTAFWLRRAPRRPDPLFTPGRRDGGRVSSPG